MFKYYVASKVVLQKVCFPRFRYLIFLAVSFSTYSIYPIYVRSSCGNTTENFTKLSEASLA